MMKTKMAMTLIDEKTDSASAKDLTLKALIPKITKAKKAAKIHCLYGRAEPEEPLCDYVVTDLLELPALLASL